MNRKWTRIIALALAAVMVIALAGTIVSAMS